MKPLIYDERLLLRDVKNNSVSAFDALYWRYHKSVYRNIKKLVKDEEFAKDILQEVFIALWEKRQLLDVEAELAGWLFTVSYRKSVDHLRNVAAKPFVGGDLDVISNMMDCSNERERESRFELLQQAVNQLSPRKKRVFELCKLEGKTYDETALELNISKHTVKEYLTAAVAHIKSYIHRHPPHPLVSALFFLLSQVPPRF